MKIDKIFNDIDLTSNVGDGQKILYLINKMHVLICKINELIDFINKTEND